MITLDSTTVTLDSTSVTIDGSNAATAPIVARAALSDLYHFWGSDLQVANDGDLLLASGTLLGQQRILRRLLTNPGEYVWHPEYGGGLPSYIGRPVDVAKLTGVIRSQMALESVVAKSPVPQITIAQSVNDFSSFTVGIAYTDAVTQTPAVLAFTVSE